MSTVPPNMPPNTPPGGGQIPPYDPKSQWKAYQTQQRAVWRAQRDAWKAQQRAARLSTPRIPSIVGPILLIAIGVVAMLVISGRIATEQFWAWYGQWWPIFLIVAGVALLGEWMLDLRRTTPVRRGGGFIGLLIVLAVVGIAAAGWQNSGFPFHINLGDNEDLLNNLGMPEHDNDQDVIRQTIPLNAVINVQNSRGDVNITAGDGQQVEVEAHLVAYANSDSKAKKIFDSEAARVTVSGNSVLVKSDSPKYGRVNLTIIVPQSAHVTVDATRGDATVAGLRAGLDLTAQQGDVHLNDLAGSIRTHMPAGNHDLSVLKIQGDLTVDGKFDQVTLTDIKGRISFNGEIYGGANGENLDGPLDLHTSVTQLQIGQLPGKFSLNTELLRVDQARGKVRAITHSKDIELTQIAGEIVTEDRDGSISVEVAGNYPVDAKNTKGDVEISLPTSLSASVEARSRNGEIISDYPLPSLGEDRNKTATFKLGAGSTRIVASAENGDVHIKKAAVSLPVPSMPPISPAPGAPHLKAPKTPPQVVNQ